MPRRSRRAGGPRATACVPGKVSVRHGACAVVHVALDAGNFCFLLEKMGGRGRPWLRFLQGHLV